MSETGKPQPAEKILSELARGTSLRMINLAKFSGSVLDIRPKDTFGKIELELELSFTKGPDPLLLTVILSLDVTGHAKADADRKIATFSCSYAAQYKFNDEDLFARVSDDALAEFGSVISLSHVWPYMREFVQSNAQKMLLPRIVLPYSGAVTKNPPKREESTPPPVRSKD